MRPMNIIISNTSDKPIYQQLFDQISAQIIKGELESGAALPAIRTVAKELRISIITVKTAWEELERQGFIYSMVGRGCFVAGLTDKDRQDKCRELAGQKLKKDVAYYKGLGLTLSDIVGLIKEYYDKEKT